MSRTVHIVEDDDPVRAALTAMLSLHDGVAICGYHSAEHFLDAIADATSGVLLLDVRMPGMSGMDVLAALGGGGSRFAAIMLTAQADVALAVRAMQAGAVDFIEKPCNRDRLLASVDTAFDTLERRHAGDIAAARARARIDQLSPRERAVLGGLVQGWSNKIIAHELALSPRTVEVHRARLMDKLEVRRLSEVLRLAFTARLLDEPEDAAAGG